jgi:hypothetical protein
MTDRAGRLEPLNCSSRRESALTFPLLQMERTHVRCYKAHGESRAELFRREGGADNFRVVANVDAAIGESRM